MRELLGSCSNGRRGWIKPVPISHLWAKWDTPKTPSMPWETEWTSTYFNPWSESKLTGHHWTTKAYKSCIPLPETQMVPFSRALSICVSGIVWPKPSQSYQSDFVFSSFLRKSAVFPLSLSLREGRLSSCCSLVKWWQWRWWRWWPLSNSSELPSQSPRTIPSRFWIPRREYLHWRPHPKLDLPFSTEMTEKRRIQLSPEGWTSTKPWKNSNTEKTDRFKARTGAVTN